MSVNCRHKYTHGILTGVICNKSIDDGDFCYAHKPLYNNSHSQFFATICENNDLDLIKKYLKYPTTNVQINDALYSVTPKIADFIINRSQFFPCSVGYEFMINCTMSLPLYDIVNTMIYKRLLIAHYLKPLLPPELIKYILDPVTPQLSKPYYYAQFMIKHWLYKNDDMPSDRYHILNTHDIRYHHLTNFKTIAIRFMTNHYISITHNDKLYIFGKEGETCIEDLNDSDLLLLNDMEFTEYSVIWALAIGIYFISPYDHPSRCFEIKNKNIVYI